MASNDKLMSWVEAQMQDYPPVLHAKHISKYLGIGAGTVYKLLSSGAIPSVKIPESKFFFVPKPLFVEWCVDNLEGGKHS